MTLQHIQTMETEARALGEDIRQHERDTLALARRAYDLYMRYAAAGSDNANRPGFKAWFSSAAGIPVGSVFYYVDIGVAAANGVAATVPAPSMRDLRAAGELLRAGERPSDVREAAQTGQLQNRAEARRGEGMCSIRLALPAKEVWDEQTERWRGLTGLPHAEAQALMVAATRYVPDDEIKRLAEVGEVVQ